MAQMFQRTCKARKLYWSQAFASDAAAIGQNASSALRGITTQEAVLSFAANFRRLILAFHTSFSIQVHVVEAAVLRRRKRVTEHPRLCTEGESITMKRGVSSHPRISCIWRLTDFRTSNTQYSTVGR